MPTVNEPTVFLLRHGATSFNKSGDSESRLKGTTYDLPLTDEGHEEAKKAAQHVAQYPIASVKHSGMQRSAQTAQHIEDATGVKSQADDSLDPWDVGYLAGHTREDAQRRLEYYIHNAHKPVPEGESYSDWHDRYASGLASELKSAEKDPTKARVLVSHSCNAMATKSVIKGTDPEFYGESGEKPGGIVKLQKKGGQWKMSDVDLGSGAESR
jgi:probable phosphoglycerate mutase